MTGTKKRALLTGATGFVGSNLCRRLLSEGHDVHVLVRPEHSSWRLKEIRNKISLHVFRPGDRESIEHVLREARPEWIFHLAAHGAYSWQKDVEEIASTNFNFTLHLLEAAVQVGFESFVNTGSSSEYGFKDHAPGEDELPEPNSYYAATKVSATMLCRFTARERNMQIPTLRLYSVYGPYEEPNRLIPTLIANGLEGRWPPIVDANVARDYVFTEDIMDAYLLAASSRIEDPGAIYNVGTGRQTTLKEVVEIARSLLDIKEEPVFGSMPNRSWDSSVWVADNRKIVRELGWSPGHTFAEGLEKTIEWFRQNPDWHSVYREQLALG